MKMAVYLFVSDHKTALILRISISVSSVGCPFISVHFFRTKGEREEEKARRGRNGDKGGI